MQGAEQLIEGNAVIPHLGQVRPYLVLLDRPPQGGHIGNPRHLPQLAGNHPVLQGTQFGGAEIGGFQAVTENFASGSGRGGHIRFHPGGQIHAAQALGHQLPGHEQGGLFVKGNDDEGEAELGVGEHPDGIWDAGQGDLQGDRHLLLHLLGGLPRVEGDHRHLGIGHIGKGLDGQIFEGGNPHPDEEQQAQDDEQGLAQGKADDALDHLAATGSARRAGTASV